MPVPGGISFLQRLQTSKCFGKHLSAKERAVSDGHRNVTGKNPRPRDVLFASKLKAYFLFAHTTGSRIAPSAVSYSPLTLFNTEGNFLVL